MPLEVLNDKDRLNSLKQMLHQYSVAAAEALIERKPDGAIQCFACGHRCLIKPGRDGVCRVRFNEDGTLLVPHGYVGALACDPIEKKPFFHVLPGSDALTFGMLGCDYHCGYCFTPDTTVITDRGPLTLDALFDHATKVVAQRDGEIGLCNDWRVISASGAWRTLEAVFRHHYRGEMTVLRPYYLPELKCTPDHRVSATHDPGVAPRLIKARELSAEHLLAVPRAFQCDGREQSIDVAQALDGHTVTHHVRWKLPAARRQMILESTAAGQSSRAIATALGTSASYVRHVRGKLRSRPNAESKDASVLVEQGRAHFPHERGTGIPQTIALDQRFARLLGLYCAEGCIVRDRKRPNSYKINFSFGHRERALAEEVRTLLKQCFGVDSQLVWRSTTLAVCCGKGTLALLLRQLCGTGASEKHVPAQLVDAPLDVARAFLEAYITGDGHRYRSGKISVTTVSHALAYGVASLALKLGHLPSLYCKRFATGDATIQGRRVRRQPAQHTVVWYEDQPADLKRRVIETPSHFLIPMRGIRTELFDGQVFNMQVADEHTYVANLLAVSNCQNWVTSQMLRDVDAVSAPKFTTPKQLVDLAIEHGAPVIASSYNEPLITSEWAVDVFKEARSRELLCAYISNGNGTPQVLDYIRPYVSAYKVDLKTFDPKHYRELGGVMENVIDTIRMLKQRGFWVEIVTLVVPGFSDDEDDLKRMADFLASVDPLMPWHMTAFHPDYKMTDGYRRTTVDDLMRIVEHGQRAGLKYMYPGNLPGQVGEWENTRCHHCGETVIERYGFMVKTCRIGADGQCPKCANVLPGIWGRSSGHGDGRVRALL